MGVALVDLVPSLRRTLNPPGETLFVAPTSEWVGRLADAFWDARLKQFFVGYVYDTDLQEVAPIEVGGDELTRDLQGIIVRYAALRAIHAKLLSFNTSVHQKAGPVEQTVQRSANLMLALLRDLTAELEAIKVTLANLNSASSVSFLDSMVIANNRVLGDWDSRPFGFVA